MIKNITYTLLSTLFLFVLACNNPKGNAKPNLNASNSTNHQATKSITDFDKTTETIHILVSLCDNKYQGIVPVPAKIGNGQDPDNNLYWGTAYGIKTYFKRSSEWKLLKSEKIDSLKMERIIFQNNTNKKIYLVADAYNGKNIKDCTYDFLKSMSGQLKDTLHINATSIGIYGNSKLISYIGHNGLMDFTISESFPSTDGVSRDCIILACYSKKYFSPYLKSALANPLVWTTGLMAPEAYTLHDAVSGYIKNESVEKIRNRAALAYAKYQKCGVKAAKNLLISGY